VRCARMERFFRCDDMNGNVLRMEGPPWLRLRNRVL
jgi:hypothetical protein